MSKILALSQSLDQAGDIAAVRTPTAQDSAEAKHPPDLGLGINTVEEQLEQLTQLVQKLTARIASEEDFRELLRAQLDEAYAASHRWREATTDQLTKVTRTAEELQYLLDQERARNEEMRMQYERQLKVIRNGIQKEKRDLKQSLVQQVDFIIRKYRSLATEAVAAARQERQKVQTERIKARELAETACRNFEKDIKERTKKALEEYRQLAQEAHKAAQAEREELMQKCTDLEKSMISKRQQLDTLVIREAEKRVHCYRLSHQNMKDQLERERRQFALMMGEIANKVEKECSDYDSAMIKAVVVFCKTKGVDIDETTLRQQLGNIRIQGLKDGSLSSERPDPRPLTVKYGFQAVTPGGAN
ncbi:protein WEAK CHLOROPLAST MOVEMENT UNDER BLUE LIGHT 1 [Cyclospora cayetanensis]|uniref:Protein WEAK CHLOROPLAST MOVEMENT UNDER BLUE LIGHT 1 n=1 Tax=Cyclospora cayetanensis TaxID=88456 RepID=A0A6P6S1K2_9EIME|nr:protein WEAK CHLOROPLAST MOVEMENT UNDER BLUE LIGHT 1 [Cyclospora cayetanensis]